MDIEICHDAVNRAGRRAIRWLLPVSFISIFCLRAEKCLGAPQGSRCLRTEQHLG